VIEEQIVKVCATRPQMLHVMLVQQPERDHHQQSDHIVHLIELCTKNFWANRTETRTPCPVPTTRCIVFCNTRHWSDFQWLRQVRCTAYDRILTQMNRNLGNSCMLRMVSDQKDSSD